VFVIWVQALVPSGPASSPIIFVDRAESPATPSQLPRQASEAEALRLLFAGDIMQHRNQKDDDFDASYAGIRRELSKAGLAIANLEFPVQPNKPVGPEIGSTRFNGSPQHVKALASAGLDVLVTSNNHAFDQGIEGLHSTLAQIKSSGAIPVGTAPSLDDLEDVQLIDLGHLQLALIAYTYTINPIREEPGEWTFHPRDLPVFVPNFPDWQGAWRSQGRMMFVRHVRNARKAGADLVIAYCHWGKEWHFQPSPNQRRAAHDLIDAGFDLVVGSHSHVLQGSEVYRGKLISYSLGNLNSDFRPWQTRTGALLEVTVATRPEPAIVDFAYLPTFIELAGHRVTLLSTGETGERLRARTLAERILGPACR
jgi:poly-gamma-glutamate synthesis protein (capsule biosynthesis protein)